MRRECLGVESERGEGGGHSKLRPGALRQSAPRLVQAAVQKPARAFPSWRPTQFLERALADLTNAFARHSHERADLLERHGLGAFVETVVEIEDLSLARREILPEDAIDELAHQLEVAVTSSISPPSTPTKRSPSVDASRSERSIGASSESFGGRHLARRAHLLGSLLDQAADLVIGGIALEHLGEHVSARASLMSCEF